MAAVAVEISDTFANYNLFLYSNDLIHIIILLIACRKVINITFITTLTKVFLLLIFRTIANVHLNDGVSEKWAAADVLCFSRTNWANQAPALFWSVLGLKYGVLQASRMGDRVLREVQTGRKQSPQRPSVESSLPNKISCSRNQLSWWRLGDLGNSFSRYSDIHENFVFWVAWTSNGSSTL